MVLALISDIHANLPALEAVLADIDARGVDLLFHLGDLVGYAPWPDEVVALLGARGVQGVSGNYDSTVALDYKHCGCVYEDPQQEALSHVSFEWTKGRVSSATRRYLGALPFRLDIRLNGGHAGGPTMVLVHGTPTLNTLYWTEDRSDDFCRKMIARAGLGAGDVLAFGHTHLAWNRVLDGVWLINTGSVGRPKDGDPRAGYTVVKTRPEGIEVEQVRVAYDVERAARAMGPGGLPDAFGTYLRTGGALRNG